MGQRVRLRDIPARKGKLAARQDISTLTRRAAGGQDVTIFYHKSPLDWGRYGQIFAGIDGSGQHLVLKRMSLLPPVSATSMRLKIYGADPEGDGDIADSLDTYDQGDLKTAAEVRREASFLQQGGGPLAGCRLLRTMRGNQVSKYFLAMPGMPGDLLEVVHRLAEVPDAKRQQVAGVVLRQLLEALAWRHRRGQVHGDIKAENILCSRDAQGHARIYLADFGAARQVDGDPLAAATAVDLSCVGVVALMLLLPETRPLDAMEKRATWRAEAHRFAWMAPLVDALLFAEVPPSAATLLHRLTEALQQDALWPEQAQRAADALFDNVYDKGKEIADRVALVRQACLDAGIALPDPPSPV